MLYLNSMSYRMVINTTSRLVRKCSTIVDISEFAIDAMREWKTLRKSVCFQWRSWRNQQWKISQWICNIQRLDMALLPISLGSLPLRSECHWGELLDPGVESIAVNHGKPQITCTLHLGDGLLVWKEFCVSTLVPRKNKYKIINPALA